MKITIEKEPFIIENNYGGDVIIDDIIYEFTIIISYCSTSDYKSIHIEWVNDYPYKFEEIEQKIKKQFKQINNE